jgi:hypothetical protein
MIPIEMAAQHFFEMALSSKTYLFVQPNQFIWDLFAVPIFFTLKKFMKSLVTILIDH